MREVFGGVRQVTFACRDLAAARAFYVDRLGFAVLEEEPERRVLVNVGTFRMRLEKAAEDPVPDAGTTTLTFRVKNLARTAGELDARGIGYEAGTSARSGDFLQTYDLRNGLEKMF